MFGFQVPAWVVSAVAGVLAAAALILIGRAWGQAGVYEDWIASNEQARYALTGVLVNPRAKVTAASNGSMLVEVTTL